MAATPSPSLPFLEHLEELRQRILKTAWIFVLLFAVCAYYAKTIFNVLQQPLLPHLNDASFFIATTASTGWTLYLKTAFVTALVVSFPFFLGQIIGFVNPGLKKSERAAVWPFLLAFVLFFYLGIAFGFFFALPYGYRFMLQIYENSHIHFLPHVTDYLNFTLTALFAFGAMFDLPFVILILVTTGLVTRQRLSRIRPYYYVAAFIVAAILTPPDYISQILMAIPLLLLFEFGLILGWIFGKRR